MIITSVGKCFEIKRNFFLNLKHLIHKYLDNLTIKDFLIKKFFFLNKYFRLQKFDLVFF